MLFHMSSSISISSYIDGVPEGNKEANTQLMAAIAINLFVWSCECLQLAVATI